MDSMIQMGHDQIEPVNVPSPDQEIEKGDRIGTTRNRNQGAFR
jgi:hypothetical protein